MADLPWMDEARQQAAQCWCDETTKHLVMDPALAEVIARHIAVWMDTGAQHARNESYWRERAHAAESARWKRAAEWIAAVLVKTGHASGTAVEWAARGYDAAVELLKGRAG